MSVEVIKSSEHVSRKKRPDDGIDYIMDWIGYGYYTGNVKLSFSEWRVIANIKECVNRNYIMPGQLYIRQFNKMDGMIYNFCMKADLFKIACKLDLFAQ